MAHCFHTTFSPAKHSSLFSHNIQSCSTWLTVLDMIISSSPHCFHTTLHPAKLHSLFSHALNFAHSFHITLHLAKLSSLFCIIETLSATQFSQYYFHITLHPSKLCYLHITLPSLLKCCFHIIALQPGNFPLPTVLHNHHTKLSSHYTQSTLNTTKVITVHCVHITLRAH